MSGNYWTEWDRRLAKDAAERWDATRAQPAGSRALSLFVPICKLDARTRTIYGVAASTAIDKTSQLNSRRPAIIHHFVHGRADGASRSQHIIDQHDG